MSKFIILSISLLFLFHFSPHTAEAKENEDLVEKDVEETEQIDSEGRELETSEIEETVDPLEDENTNPSTIETSDQDSLNSNEADQEQVDNETNIQSHSLNNTSEEDEIIDDRVIELRESLTVLGFPTTDEPENYYGESTKNAVEDFQLYYNLEELSDIESIIEQLNTVLDTPFRDGQSHTDTIRLKEDLVALGFGSFVFNENYGPKTAETVKEFQAFYGLNENGIADDRTLSKIEELLNTPMQRGDYRKDAITLKENLAKLGFNVSSSSSPEYDSETESTVEAFQEYYRLDVTGVADDATLDKLEELISTPLQEGGRHEDAIQLKEDLERLGFGSFVGNRNYGSKTASAVEDFQSYYGLKVNGIADERTLEKLESILNTPLQYGGNDPAVVELKENLVDLGFGSFNFNQNYFSTTAATVEEFQAFYGLKENGIADDRTLSKIEELLNTPMQRGDYRKDAITLKENLAKLGFNVSSSSSPEYDSETESTVQAFQEYYRLDVTGVADDATLDKLEELISTPLQEGGRHEDAIQLKEDLERLGFGSFIGNRNYGSKTASAVEDFQSYYGLKENGIADERTLEKLESILNTPLQYGGNDPLVVELKENLVALGFGSFNFNQNYFSTTEATVEEFQAFYGLKENGIADDRTLAKIEELLNTPMQRGDYRKDAITLKENLAKLGFVVSSNPTPQYGPTTESTMKEFQEYYRLDVTGVADDATLDKLEELISTPLQEGGRHKGAIQLKEDLERLGFGSFIGNRNYGSKTASAVEDFQSYYGLKENGIADERTLEKLESILNTPLQYGGNDPLVVELKENLVALGFGSFNFNQNYFSTTAATVEEFQAFYGLKENGIADDRTLAKIEELLNTPMQRGDYRKDAITLKENLAKLGFVVSSNPTPQYGPTTESTMKEFQEYYRLDVTGVADDATLDKLEELISTPLQEGGRHEDAIQLKEDLERLGFGSFIGNRNYGSKTASAVEDFQSYYGLKENGIADERTLEKLESILNTPLQYGGNDPLVVELKENLVALGFGSFNFNQNYFSTTEATVEEFQSYYGLKVNGIGDPRTLEKMEEVLNSPLREGQQHDDVVQLKADLETLGFGSFIGNTNYGSKTERAVMDFQEAYGLAVSGIADEVTLKNIKNEVNNNVVKIFLDPGHGGSDSGGTGYGLKEKNVALDIALKTAEVLTSQYLGIEIKLSRTTDTFIELVDRANMANEWGADYFVSFHANAFNGSASGFESYIFNGNVSDETRERQRDIHNYLIDRIEVNDRGMKEDNFSVLRNTSMPAILLEYMFIDNAIENALLKDANYRDWLGQITAEALAYSFGLRER